MEVAVAVLVTVAVVVVVFIIVVVYSSIYESNIPISHNAGNMIKPHKTNNKAIKAKKKQQHQQTQQYKRSYKLKKYIKLFWRCRVSNPGPFTCKANALPLSYIPSDKICSNILYMNILIIL